MSSFDILSPEQLSRFSSEGYLLLPQAVPATLLSALRKLFDELMYNDANKQRGSNSHGGQTYINSLDKLMDKGNLACLELLGCPSILSIAQSICGPDFFLIQEFAVIKMLGDTVPVLWHQDMVHQRTGNCFTMGIYLDDADAGDGALRVVPKSHTDGRDICSLQHEPFTEAPAKAGDILIHDMMLAHSSAIMQRNRMRRVLYFEFLTVSQVRQEKIYTEELLANRLQLLQLAVDYWRQQHPESPVFGWQNPLPGSAAPGGSFREQLEALCSINVKARPSAYCFDMMV